MPKAKASLALSTVTLFLACNAILGNEDHYTLVSGHGGQPDSSAGAVGEGGSVSSGGTDLGGSAGSSGANNEGGASSGGVSSGGSTTNSAGAAGQAGAGGVGGGAPECDPNAVEDCFNGFDDDCNQLADCADPACAGPASCVMARSTADLGFFLLPGQTCPSGYSAVVLHQGLTADPMCLGCTCKPDKSFCDAGVYGLSPNTCPGFQYSTILFNLFSDKCQAMPADTKLHYFDVRGFSSCLAEGTPRTSPASWAATSTFCKADKVGAGCASGSRCVPSGGDPVCTMTAGEATCDVSLFQPANGTWYTDFTDARTCSQCQCGFGISKCTGGAIQVYSGAQCTGATAQMGNGAQGDSCGALPFTPASAQISGTPETNTCPPNAYPNGELTATGAKTVCCH